MNLGLQLSDLRQHLRRRGEQFLAPHDFELHKPVAALVELQRQRPGLALALPGEHRGMAWGDAARGGPATDAVRSAGACSVSQACRNWFPTA